MKHKMDRRSFLNLGGKAIIGSVVSSTAVLLVPNSIKAADKGDSDTVNWEQVWQQQEWGFAIDTKNCIGCARCVKACKEENSVPMDEKVYRTWVERYVQKTNGQMSIESPGGGLEFTPRTEEEVTKSYFVPKLCNQCNKPPCTKVCPVGATYKTGDGVVLVDRKRCVGCGYCIQACPYGARFLHPKLKVADKCTWCYHRIVKGLLPACVQVCPTGTRVFGNLADPDNPVTPILKDRIGVLKPAMGTQPRVFYKDLDQGVV